MTPGIAWRNRLACTSVIGVSDGLVQDERGVGEPRPEPEQALAAVVRALRRHHGWSQAQLAARMTAHGFPMHQSTVANIEAGERAVRLNEAAALCAVLDVSLYDLVSGVPPLQGELATLKKRVDEAAEAYDRAKWHNRDLIHQLGEAQGRAHELRELLRAHQTTLPELSQKLTQARAEFDEALLRSASADSPPG